MIPYYNQPFSECSGEIPIFTAETDKSQTKFRWLNFRCQYLEAPCYQNPSLGLELFFELVRLL